MHSLDWNDLRYFLAVARAGTLAGAARVLAVRHTTVGRRIEALEAALGTALFNRTPDGFALTEAGGEIRTLAEEAERAALAIERRVGGNDERIAGVVRVTASDGFSGFLVRHLAALGERHPSLTVDVLTGNRFFDLTRGEADIAVRIAGTGDAAELMCRRVGASGWSVYAAAGYLARRGMPATLADLGGHAVVGFNEAMSRVLGAQWLGANARHAEVALRGDSILAALSGAIAGMGIAALPCFLADGEPTLRRLTGAVIGSKDIWLVFHPDMARKARVRAVIDFLAETMAREERTLSGEVAVTVA
jgi:DNA-binding transcriptional LysR family regulator